MEKATHTPGPWVTRDEELIGPNEAVVVYSENDDGETMCEVCEVYANPDVGGTLPNVRLITAAPDLLEACEELLRTINMYSTDPIPAGVYNRVARVAGDAIRKARGG